MSAEEEPERVRRDWRIPDGLWARIEPLLSLRIAHAPGLPQPPALCAEVLRDADAVLVVTDHSAVDYQLVAQHAPLVVDTRGVMWETRGAARVVGLASRKHLSASRALEAST